MIMGLPLRASLIFLLLFSSNFSQKLIVLGSSLHELKRPDPLRYFKDYNGAYNVTNKHYWASAAFTGVHGYAMSGVWTFYGACFGIFLIFKNIGSCNEPSSSSSSSSAFTDHLDRYCLLLFMLFLLLTLLAIVAASFVIAANHSSLQRTNKLKNTIINAGNDVFRSIRSLITALTSMQYLLLPYDPRTSQQLNVTTHRIGKASRAIQNFVRNHEHTINGAIQASYIAHLVIAIVNLILLAAVLVLLLLHWRPGLISIIVLCWILTALCWAFTGFDFFLHTFAEDSCSAFEDYVQDPKNNIFSSILPCLNSTESEKILTRIGSTLHDFIGELNSKLSEYSKWELNDQKDDLFGSGIICDPFSGAPNYSYAPEDCSDDAIPIGDIPYILSSFICYNENSTKKCLTDGKFVPEDEYNKASAYSNAVQSLINVYPDLQKLVECTVVKETFSEVFLHQCRPFGRSLQWLWASMLTLSICMVFLELIWIIKAYQERGRSFSRCSIFPNLRQSNSPRE